MNKTLMLIGSTLTLSTAFFFCSLLRSANLIESITIENNSIRIRAEREFSTIYLKSDFFAEYDTSVALADLDTTISTIPFLLNIAPIVWISQKTYSIDAMDYDLYHSLSALQKIFQAFYPATNWSGSLQPKRLVKNQVTQQHTSLACLFSHGLDAVYSSMRHHTQPQLLITVCGSDIGINDIQMWSQVKKLCSSFAQEHGHGNGFVRSNFNSFRKFSHLVKLTNGEIGNWFGQTSQSLGYTGLAAPIAYAHGCSTLLIASTRTSDNPFPYGTHPVIDNAIAFAGIHVEHDAPETNRLEKIREIAALCTKYALKKPMLRVCWGNDPLGGNCTTCEKCFRTIVELLIEQQIPEEYGFKIPLTTAIEQARKYAPGKKVLSQGLLWHWGCIQQAAQSRCTEPHSTALPELKNLISWLAKLDLQQFSNPKARIRSAQEKEAYAILWQKAAAGTFCLKDLDLVTSLQQKLHSRLEHSS